MRQFKQPTFRPDKFPTDWDQDFGFRGFSRNPALKLYDIRLSVGGKQYHIGYARDQDRAAWLYDLALWRLCPKMSRKVRLNFPDDFGFLTQETVDRECPRLNAIYASLPFACTEDEELSDEFLRERWLKGEIGPARPNKYLTHYNSALQFLKRTRLRIDETANRIASERQSLIGLVKLPAVTARFLEAERLSTELSVCLKELDESMEGHRAYYQKVVGESLVA